MTNIVIADDHPMVIKGIEQIVGYDNSICLIATYSTAAELLTGLSARVPDVLLLDIHLPDTPGDTLAPVLLKQYPCLKILVLTNADSPLYLRNMLRIGVHGYALKTIDPSKLIQAINTIHRGGAYLDDSLKDKVDNSQLRNKRETFLKAQLTARELEILQLVADGFTAQEIAARLFVGIKTVEYYRINLLLKMDAKNTAMLVRKALEAGLVQ